MSLMNFDTSSRNCLNSSWPASTSSLNGFKGSGVWILFLSRAKEFSIGGGRCLGLVSWLWDTNTGLWLVDGGVTLSVLALSASIFSMGTPTPISSVSGSKSGGGRTGSRYGAWKSSIGLHGLSYPSLSGVEPPFKTNKLSSANQTWNIEIIEIIFLMSLGCLRSWISQILDLSDIFISWSLKSINCSALNTFLTRCVQMWTHRECNPYLHVNLKIYQVLSIM